MIEQGAPPIKDSIENIEKSMASCAMALSHLEHSLKQAGFDQSIDTYKTMTDTILGQKLYLQDNSNDEIELHFSNIVESATEIHKIFKSYADILNKFCITKVQPELYSVSKATTNKKNQALFTPPTTPDQKALAQLKKEKRPISASRLRSKLGLGRQDFNLLMKKLSDKGLINTEKSGGRQVYSLCQ